MQKIHIIARFKIQSNNLEKFKQGVQKCIDLVKNEPGAELYDWFIDEKNMECTVIETYKDSDATLFHAGNVQQALGELMQISEFSGEVFGNASEALKEAMAGMNIVPVPFYIGLDS